jgi:hypothetical protein
LHERRGFELRAENKIADHTGVPDSGMPGAVVTSGIAAATGLRAAALRFAGRLARFAGEALRTAFFFAFLALRFAGAARWAAAPRFLATLRLAFPLDAVFFFVFRAMIVSSREFSLCARSASTARTFNEDRSLLRLLSRFQ